MSNYNFKDNLTIDNNKYMKWLDTTGVSRSNVLGINTNGNLNINSDFGGIIINPSGDTFINSNLKVSSKLTINSTSNAIGDITMKKNGYIGVNSTIGSNDGFLGISGSYSMDTKGARMVLYANEHVSEPSNLILCSGTNGNVKIKSGDDSLKMQVLSNGTTLFTPNGTIPRLSISDTNSIIANDLLIASTTQSNNASSGCLQLLGGMGVRGNLYVDGTISLNSATGNINFNSTEISTSYTTGAIFLSGGIGISSTANSTSVFNGGAISIAGGMAIGRDTYIGGSIYITSTSPITDSLSGSIICYGGLGINDTIYSRSSNIQIKLAPQTNGSPSQIVFYSQNNFASGSTGNSSWNLGQNVNGIGSGLFGLSNSDFGVLFSSNFDGSMTFNGNIKINNTLDSTCTTDGSLTVAGGASISKNLFIGGPVLQIPSGTIRPSNPQNGYIRYNNITSQFEGYNTGNWGSLGGVIDVNQTTKILAENSPGSADMNLRFITNSIERMRINSAGNVGINTSSPGYLLDINGTFNATNTVVENNLSIGNLVISSNFIKNSLNTSILYIQSSSGNIGINTTSPGYTLDINGTLDADILKGNFISCGSSVMTSVNAGSNNTIGNLFTNNGKIGINNTNPSFTLDITGDTHISGNLYIDNNILGKYTSLTGSLLIQDSTDSNGTNGGSILTLGGTSIQKSLFVGQNINANNIITNSTTVGNIFINSTVNSLGLGSGGSLTVAGGASFSKDVYIGAVLATSSDIRLKTNISQFNKGEKVIDKINRLNTISYSYISDTTQKQHIGFIAQDFLQDFSEIVNSDPNGFYSLDYQKITVILMECIKELRKELQELKVLFF